MPKLLLYQRLCLLITANFKLLYLIFIVFQLMIILKFHLINLAVYNMSSLQLLKFTIMIVIIVDLQ